MKKFSKTSKPSPEVSPLATSLLADCGHLGRGMSGMYVITLRLLTELRRERRAPGGGAGSSGPPINARAWALPSQLWPGSWRAELATPDPGVRPSNGWGGTGEERSGGGGAGPRPLRLNRGPMGGGGGGGSRAGPGGGRSGVGPRRRGCLRQPSRPLPSGRRRHRRRCLGLG